MTTARDIARGITKNIAKEIAGRVNILTNGGFENGTTGWTPQGTATIVEETGTVHSGSKSLKLTRGGAGNAAVQQGVATAIGVKYNASGWLFLGTGATIAFFHVGSTPFTTNLGLANSSAAGWNKYTLTFTAITTTSYIGSSLSDSTGDIMYLDDFEVYKAY